MKFKLYYCLLFVLLISMTTYAQNSFIKSLDFSNTDGITIINPSITDIFEEESDGSIKLSLIFYGTSGIIYLDIAANGDLIAAHHLLPPGPVGSTWYGYLGTTDFEYKNDYYVHTINETGDSLKSAIFIHHGASQNFWGKQLSPKLNQRGERVCITDDDKVLTTHHTEYVPMMGIIHSPKVGLSYLDLKTGDPLWTYYYEILDNSLGQNIAPIEISQFPSNDFAVLHFIIGAASSPNYKGNIVQKINIQGELVGNIAFPSTLGRAYAQCIDGAGNLYLTGYIYNEEDPDIKDGYVMKISSDLELIWAKRLLADEYNYENIRIAVDNENNLSFIYTTSGDFPTITGRISPNGDLLDYTGYAMYAAGPPVTETTKDKEALMVSYRKYHADGSIEPAMIIMKTNTDGSFDDCSTYPACLTLEDFDIEFDVLDWERQVAEHPKDIATAVNPIDVTLEDYCPTPPFPSPYFSITNQVCPAAIVEADSLDNRFANNQIWHIQGPELDTLIDNDSLRITLPLEGTYMITQSIWVLGCEYSYSRAVEVVDEGSVDLLGEDRIACETPYVLAADRPFSSQAVYSWNTTDTNETIAIDTSGIYALSVEDYGCVYTDSVQIDLLEELEPSAAITFALDSMHCEELLPFALQALNAYTDTFWLASKPNERLPILQLNQAATYKVQAQVGDCIVSAEYSLETTDCQSEIYLPNVFSPNDDGVNDVLAPLGKNFEGIQLSVYDRWGTLVHQSNAAPFEWRVQGGQEAAPSAVYMVVFEYVNKLTGAKEVLSADVLLL